MSKRVIVFNSPPRTGKDTIRVEVAHAISESIQDYVYLPNFKDKLIEIALCISGVSENEWNERYNHSFDDDFGNTYYSKNIPWDRLAGKSQRDYLIHVSENVVKPLHGKDYFGQQMANKIKSYCNDCYVFIADGGFDEEMHPVNDIEDVELTIYQWAREGEQWTFEAQNDSRNYLKEFPSCTVDMGVVPDGGLSQLLTNILLDIRKRG